MSDDTPTDPFGASGDAPTERFDVAAAQATGGETPTELLVAPSVAPAYGGDSAKKSRRRVIILACVGGALMLALIVVLIALLTRGTPVPVALPTATASASSTPSPTAIKTPRATPSAPPSATPSATPSASPSPTMTVKPTPTPTPPPDTTSKIDSFTVGSNTIFCNQSAPVTPSYELSFSWSSSNVSAVYFGIDTNDASTAPFYDNLPPSGNSGANFSSPVSFPCYTASQTYTLTVLGSGGQKVSKTVTVTNIGDKP
jgi:hypothetical protein